MRQSCLPTYPHNQHSYDSLSPEVYSKSPNHDPTLRGHPLTTPPVPHHSCPSLDYCKDSVGVPTEGVMDQCLTPTCSPDPQQGWLSKGVTRRQTGFTSMGKFARNAGNYGRKKPLGVREALVASTMRVNQPELTLPTEALESRGWSGG